MDIFGEFQKYHLGLALLTDCADSFDIMTTLSYAPVSVCEKHLGGVNHVRQKLATLLKTARMKNSLSPDVMNALCNFGRTGGRNKLPLPICQEYEESPEKINGVVLSIALNTLRLTGDDVLTAVLGRKLTIAQRKRIAHDMSAQGIGLRGTRTDETNVETPLVAMMTAELSQMAMKCM
jgi:hypothetical protein